MTRTTSVFLLLFVLMIASLFTNPCKASSNATQHFLDSPKVKLKDTHEAFLNILEMDENLSFLRASRAILHTLNQMHAVSSMAEIENIKAMISKSKSQKLTHAGNKIEHIISFDAKSTHVSEEEKANLKHFIQNLRILNHSYADHQPEFKVSIRGYANDCRSVSEKKKVAHARAKNITTILNVLAKENNINLHTCINDEVLLEDAVTAKPISKILLYRVLVK